MTSPVETKSLVFANCQQCPFHKGVWTEEDIERDSEGKWKDGAPTCVCVNSQVMRPGNYRMGRDDPVVCKAHHGNCRPAFKGAFPKWCPLKAVNEVREGGFFGESSIVPPEEWLKGRMDSDAMMPRIHQTTFDDLEVF